LGAVAPRADLAAPECIQYATRMAHHHHLIDGVLEPGTREFDVVDPATGQAFTARPDATREDVDRAMAAAARVFAGSWSRDEPARRRVLARMGDVLAERAEAIGEPVCREQGSRWRTPSARCGARRRYSAATPTSRSRAKSSATT
jgi:acyl-CoA reductase-like NAD-dependent aldehyde dehydrogenase